MDEFGCLRLFFLWKRREKTPFLLFKYKQRKWVHLDHSKTAAKSTLWGFFFFFFFKHVLKLLNEHNLKCLCRPPAGADSRVLLSPRDVCQCQQLQPGRDGGWHSGVWRGAAPLGQEPRGVCAHKSPGEKLSYGNTFWKFALCFNVNHLDYACAHQHFTLWTYTVLGLI